MKNFLKKLLKSIPIDFTKNQKYDTQTQQIIAKVCTAQSNTIDVGCHKGEVMDLILAKAHLGQHFGFEPIPDMYQGLVEKYKNTNCVISDIALSNETGFTTFNYVVSNPAYSGLKKRKYDREDEQDTTIQVKIAPLDSVLDKNIKIDLIKIDVEGGELLVLEGAQESIKRNKPVIIFEHGLGASEFYNSSPEKVYQLLKACGLKVSLMKRWLNQEADFTEEQFKNEFYTRNNYYFIAYP
jgi:FkbM family methyltransferase